MPVAVVLSVARLVLGVGRCCTAGSDEEGLPLRFKLGVQGGDAIIGLVVVGLDLSRPEFRHLRQIHLVLA